MFGNLLEWGNKMKIILMVSLCLVASCSGAEVNLPSRSECIVKVDFSGHLAPMENLEMIYPRISQAIRSAHKNGFVIRAPSMVVSNKDRRSIYLQYRERCSERHYHTENLFREFVEPNVPEVAGYEISNEIITPSPETIDVNGIYWSD